MQSVPHQGRDAATPMLTCSRRRAKSAAQVALIALLSVVAGCSDEPTKADLDTLEALPVERTTVVAAVEFITPSPLKVPASCGGSLEINCVNGVPGEPVSFNIARGPVASEKVASEPAYSFSTTLAVTSVNISARASGITCAVAVNSADGTSTTFNMVGHAEFTSHTGDAVLNRVDVQADVNGIESEDVQVTGGSACALASSFKAQVIAALTDALSSQRALCGAPGPALLEECPPMGMVPARALRRR